MVELSSCRWWWWCSRFCQTFFCLLGLLQMRRFFSSEFYLCFFFSEGAIQNSFRHVHNIVPCTYILFVWRKFRAYGCCITLILLMFVFTLCVRRTSRASACWILPFLSFIFEGLVTSDQNMESSSFLRFWVLFSNFFFADEGSMPIWSSPWCQCSVSSG